MSKFIDIGVERDHIEAQTKANGITALSELIWNSLDADATEINSKILLSKSHVIYCFSEAHLYDLNRDSSAEKYKDMDFLQTISDNNCFFFKDYTRFEYKTPREYYDDFDWSPVSSFEDLSNEYNWIFATFKAIPLNLADYIKAEDLPANMPLSMVITQQRLSTGLNGTNCLQI